MNPKMIGVCAACLAAGVAADGYFAKQEPQGESNGPQRYVLFNATYRRLSAPSLNVGTIGHRDGVERQDKMLLRIDTWTGRTWQFDDGGPHLSSGWTKISEASERLIPVAAKP